MKGMIASDVLMQKNNICSRSRILQAKEWMQSIDRIMQIGDVSVSFLFGQLPYFACGPYQR
jgi:hypothetical protein